MSVFAHRCDIDEIDEDLITNYILGNINELPERLEKEVEAFYFASCLVVQKEPLKKLVDGFGGIEPVLGNSKMIEAIARVFNAPYEITRMRLLEIYNEKKNTNPLKLNN